MQPADADVLIDGERWEGPADDEALVLQVAPGPHRIEVRRDGYRGYTAQIDVRAGRTTPINVSLPRQQRAIRPTARRPFPQRNGILDWACAQ